MHTPTRQRGRQYRSALFYADEEQKQLAEDAVRYLKQQLGTVYVDIEPWTKFYRAEEYHQDYLSKRGMKK
jgi:peptide methionine sulfoxide reductase MsrA